MVQEYNSKTEQYNQKTNIDSNTLYTLRKEVLQAFGRECYDLYKVNEYFKGYDETISTDSITKEDTANYTTKVTWYEDIHKATLTITKKSGVSSTLRIQYLVNPSNLEISDNSKWINYDENRDPITKKLFVGDQVYVRLFDGTYDGDYTVINIKDNIAPEYGKIEVIEGKLGNNGYYVSDTIKIKITQGKDKESGVSELTYQISGDMEVSEQTISNGAVIEISNNGKFTIKSTTYDCSQPVRMSTPVYAEIKKDSLSPTEPTIEVIGDIGNNSYYNSNVTIKFKYGQEREQPSASGIKGLYYEITTDSGIKQGWADYDGQEFVINTEGGIGVKAYMEDNAGNMSAVVIKEINRDITSPSVIASLSASNITTNSFRLNIGVKDEVSGIDKIVWHYRRSDASIYTSIPTDCSGKTQITKSEDITGLYSGVYYAYAEVYDKAGNKTQTGILKVTTLNLETAGGATASPTGWTNENVTVTLPTQTGYTTQYQTGTLNESGTWSTYSSAISISSNTKVYYRYNDGTNAGTYGVLTIANIDTTKPTISTALSSSGVTTKGFTLNIGVTDTLSGLGKIVWYYKLSSASSYTSVEEVYTTLNGSTTGTKTAVTKTKAFDKLISGTYNAYAVVYDVAGNSTKSSTITITLGTLQKPEIKITNVKVTSAGWSYTISADTSDSGIYYIYHRGDDKSQTSKNTYTVTGTTTEFSYKVYVETCDGTNTSVSSEKITLSPIRLYIRQLYQALRDNNDVREDEVNYWNNFWNGTNNTHSKQAAWVAYGILASKEAENKYEGLSNKYNMLDVLYKGILGREPDAGGKETNKVLIDPNTTWSNISFNAIAAFTDSNEGQTIYKDRNIGEGKLKNDTPYYAIKDGNLSGNVTNSSGSHSGYPSDSSGFGIRKDNETTYYGAYGHTNGEKTTWGVTITVPTNGLKYLDVTSYLRNWGNNTDSEYEKTYLEVKSGDANLLKYLLGDTGYSENGTYSKTNIDVSSYSSVTINIQVITRSTADCWVNIGLTNVYFHN